MTEPAWLSEVCGDCGESYRECICGGAHWAEVRYLRGEKEAEVEELSERLAAAQITIGQLSHERARLREGLARLEWNKDGHCNGCTGFRYESGSMTHGHEPGCWVAAELRTERQKAPPPL